MVRARRSVTRRLVVAVTGAAFVGSVVGTSSVFWPGGLRLALRSIVGPTRLVAATVRTRSLRLYYTSPVLVRRGERVVMPVDVVCVTEQGTPCSTQVQIGTRVGSEGWRALRAPGGPMRVDLSAPAGRARSSRAVQFYVRATDGAGTVSSLGSPAGGGDEALRFYVTNQMPVVRLPALPFGDVRPGQTVLALPWGTGPLRVGLDLGNESDTVGPASFDVDAADRIFLLDGLQERLAVFTDGRLVRDSGLPTGPHLDVAVAPDGSATVVSRSGPDLVVRRVDPAGSIGAAASLGPWVDGHVEMVGAQAFAELLPVDAWISVPSPGDALSASPVLHAGRPLSDGSEILGSARPDSIRLAMVEGDVVSSAIEVHSDQSLGEVELAEPDGEGGYWFVVHVWQESPTPADQYQVAHVRGGELLSSFAVAGRHFATVPPLNRFRLAPDGFLYQMTSSPEGIRIVRYELGGKP